jgi:cytochrome c oxidase assembly protein subunit 15
VLALTVTAFVLTLAWRARAAALPQAVRRAVMAFGAVITVQLVVGITTLLLAVPVPLGVFHQFTGVLALTAALIATQRAATTVATVSSHQHLGEEESLRRAAAPRKTTTVSG